MESSCPRARVTKEPAIGAVGAAGTAGVCKGHPYQMRSPLPGPCNLISDKETKNPLVSKLPIDEAGNGGAETERKTEAQSRAMFGGSTKSGTRSQES